MHPLTKVGLRKVNFTILDIRQWVPMMEATWRDGAALELQSNNDRRFQVSIEGGGKSSKEY